MNNTTEKCCQASTKHTYRSEEAKKRLINRLSRIEGQIRGIKNMIENDAYCNDLLTQSAAASAALSAFSREIISSHLKTCVSTGLKNGNEDIINELCETLEKFMK